MILIYCWRNLHSMKCEAADLTLWSRSRSFDPSCFLGPSLYHSPSAASKLLLCVHPLHAEVVLTMPSFLQPRWSSKRCHPSRLPPPRADLSHQITKRGKSSGSEGMPARRGWHWSRRGGRCERGQSWLPRGAQSMPNLVIMKSMIPREIKLALNARKGPHSAF